MIAEIRKVCDQDETNQKRGKDRQKLVERHASALPENLVPPGFPDGTAKQASGMERLPSVPKLGYAILHLVSV